MDAHAFAAEEPFPEDIKVAQPETLSLKGLETNDGGENQRLFEACKAYGFFYLALEDSATGQTLLKTVEKMFEFAQNLFDLPEDEKMRYDLKDIGSFYGYKGVGGSVVNKEGRLDRMEAWNVLLGKDDILQTGPQNPNPAFIQDSRPLLQSYMRLCHSISMTLLRSLERSLRLPEGRLLSLHQLSMQSGDQVRVIKCIPQQSQDRSTALGEHTDFGSVTVLFNRVAGLRIVEPGVEESYDDWPWVRPKPGHAIVNIGDALVKFTNGLFRSNVHRVDPPPSSQVSSVRYSLGYFARPGDDVVLRRLNDSDGVVPPLAPGEVEDERTSKDWLLSRFLGRRVGVFKGADHWDRIQGTEELTRSRDKPASPSLQQVVEAL